MRIKSSDFKFFFGVSGFSGFRCTRVSGLRSFGVVGVPGVHLPKRGCFARSTKGQVLPSNGRCLQKRMGRSLRQPWLAEGPPLHGDV